VKTTTLQPTAAHPTWTPPSATAADLLRQVRDVAGDVPRFVVSPFLRRWHRTWGATRDEVAAEMPGDALLPEAQYRCTRAITIAASREEVWPWLVQAGCGRAGRYSDDLLDNFTRPSAREVVPELQDQRVGQWLAMVPRPSDRTAFAVDGFARPSWLLWRTPNRSWAWRLTPLPGGGTRLVTRMHTVYEWRRPWTAGTVLLMELADYPMMRRMLRGLRDRAEAGHRDRGSG
jgi:hypothetical protein